MSSLLVADSRLYKGLCPSIGPFVGPSIGPSVSLSVMTELKSVETSIPALPVCMGMEGGVEGRDCAPLPTFLR